MPVNLRIRKCRRNRNPLIDLLVLLRDDRTAVGTWATRLLRGRAASGVALERKEGGRVLQ
jgi:hypothetical protein